ncbi:MAG: single-stranded DNA-binding protein [bacterium]
MASMNKVILMGNLTKDPELKELPSGTPVADMRLALNETYTDRSGKKVEKVCYIDVVVWERQAQTCAQYLKKGSPVLVEGRLEMNEWKTKEGETRTRIRVRADRVQFISSGRRDEDGEKQAPVADRKPVESREPAHDEDDLRYDSEGSSNGGSRTVQGPDSESPF